MRSLMSVRDELQAGLKQSLLAKDSLAVSSIRLILAALKDRDIAVRTKGQTQIEEVEIYSMLQSMIKQRNESAELYQNGNRPELAKQEMNEIEIISKFLPKQMSTEEVVSAVNEAFKEVVPQGLKDMSKIMAVLRERYVGKMDFKSASDIVKQRLG